jgi:hypothetical protein
VLKILIILKSESEGLKPMAFVKDSTELFKMSAKENRGLTPKKSQKNPDTPQNSSLNRTSWKYLKRKR